MRTNHTTRVAAWGSGGGSTFFTVAQQLHEGVIGGFEFGAVITDRPGAGILEKAEYANKHWGMDIQPFVVDRQSYPAGRVGRGITDEQSYRVCEIMSQTGTRNLALLGCTAILRGVVIQMYGWDKQLAVNDPLYQGRYESFIQNTHPAILPATADTYGVGASRKVYELGLSETAHTFHVVGADIDAGPVIAEHRLDVPRYDTSTPARLDAAAQHLFTLVQTVEKAHLGLDMERYYTEQRMQLPY